MSEELPEGWAEQPLGNGLISNIQTGFACGKHSRDGKGMAHLRPMNVSEAGRVVLDDVKFIDAREADRDERLLRRGDVVFNNTNSPELVGKTGLYEFAEPRAFSNHMTRLRCTENVLDPKFCAFVLHHRWQQGYFYEKCNNHVSQASVGREVLLATEVALPPLPEQRRIVEKVESLLEEVNRARVRLERMPLILKRFRQAVLAAACSGELTRDWREERPELESGESIIQRLSGRAERAKRFANGLELREDFDLPDLPESWAWATLRFLAEPTEALCYGVVQPGDDDPQGVPLVRAGDLHDLSLAPKGLRRVSRSVDESYRRSRLKGGELLVTVVGANVGTVARAPAAVIGCNIARAVVKVPVREVDAGFVLHWLRSSVAYHWMFGDAREVARPTLNIEQLETLPVPVPPLEEQAEIIRQVDCLFALADTIERRVQAATSRAEKLPQAILSKAFSGELVATEAELARAEGRTYETADELLARVHGPDVKANGSARTPKTSSRKRRKGEQAADA